MTCPKCWSETKVVDSRKTVDSVIRKRKCKSCGYMFWTEEVEFDFAKNRKTEHGENLNE